MIDLFKSLYMANIQPTGKLKTIKHDNWQTYLDNRQCISLHQESVIGFYIPESRVNALITEATKSEREREIRKQNPQLNELYIQYQMMLNLYK